MCQVLIEYKEKMSMKLQVLAIEAFRLANILPMHRLKNACIERQFHNRKILSQLAKDSRITGCTEISQT
jgi:hypothetical protein